MELGTGFKIGEELPFSLFSHFIIRDAFFIVSEQH